MASRVAVTNLAPINARSMREAEQALGERPEYVGGPQSHELHSLERKRTASLETSPEAAAGDVSFSGAVV